MKRYLAATTALGLALGVHTHQAAADVIHITDVEFSYGGYGVTVTATSTGADPSANTTSDGTTAGQFVFTGTNQTNPGQTIWDVWCVDLFHQIHLGSQSTDFTQAAWNTADAVDNATSTPHALTATQVSEMAALMAIGNGVLQGSSLSSDNGAFGVSGASQTDWSAAIQTAIWDVEYTDQYYTFSQSGLSGYALTIYSELTNPLFLAGLDGLGATGLFALPVGGTQSFAYNTTSFTLIPEPGSMALLGTALVGFGWLRRRRRKTV